MLTTLNFQIVVPTAANFFFPLQAANSCNEVEQEIVQYILELGLLSIHMLQYTPSQMVSAALLLNNWLTGRINPPDALWPKEMVLQSRQTQASVLGCFTNLYNLFMESWSVSQLQNPSDSRGGRGTYVREKFARINRHQVSLMSPFEMGMPQVPLFV